MISFLRRRAPKYLRPEPSDPVPEASEGDQPVGVTTSPEVAEVAPMTMERLMLEHPSLVEEVRAEAKAEYLREHPAPSPGARALIDGSRVQGAAAELKRVLGIMDLALASERWDIGLKLARMPSMSVETARILMADMPKQASGPDAEFHAVMAAAHPAPVDDQDEVASYLKRVKALDAEMLAEAAQRARARAVEGR